MIVKESCCCHFGLPFNVTRDCEAWISYQTWHTKSKERQYASISTRQEKKAIKLNSSKKRKDKGGWLCL